MALPTASDNPYPSVLLNETTAPAAPAASKRRLYVDASHILRWIDSASLDSPLAALNKWNATAAPAVTDDSGDGYAVGSQWIDTTNDKAYVCLDASVGAAVWTETTQAGAGAVATDAIWDAAGDLAVGSGANTAAKLAIGAAGTLPVVSGGTLAYAYAPPFHGCRAYNAGTQSFTTATETTVLFDSEEYDTDGFHEAVTNPGRITIPAGLGGYYRLRVEGYWNVNPTGATYVFFRKNGTTAIKGHRRLDATPFVPMTEVIIPLVATDYVEVRVYETSTGGPQIGAATYETVLEAMLVGI